MFANCVNPLSITPIFFESINDHFKLFIWIPVVVHYSFYSTSLIQNDVSWIPNQHYSGVYGLMKLQLPYVLPSHVHQVSNVDIKNRIYQGIFTTFPQCNFRWNFQRYSVKILCYHWLSMSRISIIMHCEILINMPYSSAFGSPCQCSLTCLWFQICSPTYLQELLSSAVSSTPKVRILHSEKLRWSISHW